MANRKQRAAIAAETLEILERGSYDVDGREVSIADTLAASCKGTRLYTPEELDKLVASSQPSSRYETAISVANCTSFAAVRQLLDEGFEDPLCLNFASAKNPGGGFRSGSQAQEECLARASGLHATLDQETPMIYYYVNRGCRTALYTNHAIYSPRVPVFRDDEDQLLAEPYTTSIVTSPAVNAGAVRKNQPQRVDEIEGTMRHRMRSILAIALANGHSGLVLGAWGCGVFGNDPALVAQWFRDTLSEPPFAGAFDRVAFGVLDFAADTPTFNAFRDVFAT